MARRRRGTGALPTAVSSAASALVMAGVAAALAVVPGSALPAANPPAVVRPAADDPGPAYSVVVAGAVLRASQATPELPDLPTPPGSGAVPTAPLSPGAVERAAATPPAGGRGIPEPVLAAYRSAAAGVDCGLDWSVLAGIGRIESGHAAGGRVDAAGTTRGRILGPRLDGSLPGTAVIGDSDGGLFDGDPAFDRATGPMQFLPGTWRGYGADGNGDGVADPNNVADAALAAARYLCAGGGDLRRPADLAAALYRYNRSAAYGADVIAWAAAYRTGARPVPPGTGPVPPGASVLAAARRDDGRSSQGTESAPPVAQPPVAQPPVAQPPTPGPPTVGPPTVRPPTPGPPTVGPPTVGPPSVLAAGPAVTPAGLPATAGPTDSGPPPEAAAPPALAPPVASTSPAAALSGPVAPPVDPPSVSVPPATGSPSPTPTGPGAPPTDLAASATLAPTLIATTTPAGTSAPSGPPAPAQTSPVPPTTTTPVAVPAPTTDPGATCSPTEVVVGPAAVTATADGALLRFAAPAPPAGCAVSAAMLRFTPAPADRGKTLRVTGAASAAESASAPGPRTVEVPVTTGGPVTLLVRDAAPPSAVALVLTVGRL